MDFDGLRSDIVHMLVGGRVRIKTGSFRNDMKNLEIRDDVLTLLVHLGYLGYDSEKEDVFIPNKEIIREFENAMHVGGWQEVMRVLKASERYRGEIVLVGVDYDRTKADKPHSCVIDRIEFDNQ